MASKRCGTGDKCPEYDKHNRVSGCKIFDDRNDCTKSLSHKNKVSKHSRKTQKNNHANIWR